MRIACLMMQKNERDLIQPWIDYHAWLFGLDNLFVFDNGSTDPKTLSILKLKEEQGLYVNYTFNTKRDFEQKGRIVASLICELDTTDEYDFFFPLDCDEFIACMNEDGQIGIGLEALESSLSAFIDEPRVLAIQGKYRNSPLHQDWYLAHDGNKCFFARKSCVDLDTGFHQGVAKTTTEQIRTPILYFEFCYKPYAQYRHYALEKLAGRVGDFDRDTLTEHYNAKRSGWHLAYRLLMSESEYNSQFSMDKRIHYPQLRARVRSLGSCLTFDLQPLEIEPPTPAYRPSKSDS